MALLIYVDYDRTTQETCLWASTLSYGDKLNFLYIDDVRISQKEQIWASTACYRDSFTFLLASV
jgi:hypothetical protein